MDIRIYTINDLKEALKNNDLWKTNVISIPRQRALAHIHNPRAKENDPVLFVAYIEDEVAGYIGVLPDLFYIAGQPVRMVCGSTGWVDEKYKKEGIYVILLMKALELYNDHFFVASVTESVKKVFDAFPQMNILKKFDGYRYILRSNLHELLPQKYSTLRQYTGWLKMADCLANRLVDVRMFFFRTIARRNKNIFFEYIRDMDQETLDFISRTRKNELLQRDEKVFNWLLRYPWVIETSEQDSENKKYYFSSVAKRFHFLMIKVFDRDHSLTGFMILLVRNNNLTMPYCYFEISHARMIIDVLHHHLMELKITMFITYQEEINQHFRYRYFPLLLRKSTTRTSYITKAFENSDFSRYHFQDGFGDWAFT